MSTVDLDKEVDLRLLERWQADDRQAGKCLVLRYHGDVIGFFRNAAGDDERTDLVRETFVRFSKSHEAFRRDASVRTHLYQIARHVLIDHLATDSHGSPRVFDPLTHSGIDLSGTQWSRLASSFHDSLLECLRALPVDTKQLLELYHWHRCTPGELGKIFEQPQAVILPRLADAMEVLRQSLANKLAEPTTAAISDVQGLALEQALRDMGIFFGIG